MKLKEITYDKIPYVAPSWDQMGTICFELAKIILNSGKKYDRVVALAKGGWTWARALVDYLGIEHVASVQIKFYSGVYETNNKPTIVQPLAVNITKENVLIFDDVADSGKTFAMAKDYLIKCGAKSVDTASLFYKPHSSFRPDYYIYETRAWVIFPHEMREIVETAGKNWLKTGLAKEAVLKRFKSLELPMEQMEFYLKQL
ncbi:MAG: phosphoribosyltransferase [Patescibacteria group bacterium]|nr:phosphoribosyltransferase [Patescibacteria group bacterium]